MAGLIHDDSRFPFVFIRFPPENATDEQVRWLIEQQRQVLGRKQRFVQLVDATKPSASSATQRRMYADWMRESEAPSKLYCVGMAVVIASPIMRGALQAVLWLFRPPMPVESFATLDEAAARAEAWMRKEGLPNADAVRAVLAKVA